MRGVAVVLDSLYDAGNQAAAFRSVEAFGFMDCHVVNPAAAKKGNPRAVSRGSTPSSSSVTISASARALSSVQ